MTEADNGRHYVYIYRDDSDRIRYVGYGGDSERAASHADGSHNPGLDELISGGRYSIEIAGPFDKEETGRAVESALISALRSKELQNRAPGESRWRFRPLGVPAHLADRLVAEELGRDEFLGKQAESPTPVLFVKISRINFEDRVGYDPARPPSDAEICQRVDRWWQLQRLTPLWAANPKSSPGLLVGVFGSPGRQIVIASLRIDRDAWATAETKAGRLLRIPLLDATRLDAFDLRGRRIARNAGLRFGGVPAQFFAILGTDGSLSHGRPTEATGRMRGAGNFEAVFHPLDGRVPPKSR